MKECMAYYYVSYVRKAEKESGGEIIYASCAIRFVLVSARYLFVSGGVDRCLSIDVLIENYEIKS